MGYHMNYKVWMRNLDGVNSTSMYLQCLNSNLIKNQCVYQKVQDYSKFYNFLKKRLRNCYENIIKLI